MDSYSVQEREQKDTKSPTMFTFLIQPHKM